MISVNEMAVLGDEIADIIYGDIWFRPDKTPTLSITAIEEIYKRAIKIKYRNF